ncbi:MAG: hypothetical protein E7398_06080 [Ruminococcaceae bacterium]|nr:hypothetical protein [Oscillospiraceae bacterium]
MIKEYAKEKAGFNIVMKSEGWQMAIVTYDEQYDAKNQMKIARHMTTDEAFVLIEGKATLLAVDENDRREEISLMKNKIYVVEKATWHSLVLSRDAVLIAAENADVVCEDTERKVL